MRFFLKENILVHHFPKVHVHCGIEWSTVLLQVPVDELGYGLLHQWDMMKNMRI